MAVKYECDMCDRSAAIEVQIRVLTPSGILFRTLEKHLCDHHRHLVRDFEISLIPTSDAKRKP